MSVDPGYETIIDSSELAWTVGLYILHGIVAGLQVALACYLLGTGLRDLLLPHLDGPWIRKLGAIPANGARSRALGALRVLVGAFLLTPAAVGAPATVSLIAGLAAFALLLVAEFGLPTQQRRAGRLARWSALVVSAIIATFMVWEGEDNLVLGVDLARNATEGRRNEREWQLSKDPGSPKPGELAPDFELQDPNGQVRVRLSDFRDKRPVVLVFGSYT